MVVEVLSDGGFELLGGAEATSTYLLFSQGGEEAFDLVEPTCRGRREVNVVAGMTDQPALHGGRFVGCIVVYHQTHLQLRRHVGFEGVDEFAKFDGPVPALELADDLAGADIEGGEQAPTHIGRVRRAVSDLDRSIAFHTLVIGLSVLRRNGSLAFLGTAEDSRILLELKQIPGVRPISRRTRPGLYYIAFLLPNRAALGSFLRHLHDLRIEFGAGDHLVSEAYILWTSK